MVNCRSEGMIPGCSSTSQSISRLYPSYRGGKQSGRWKAVSRKHLETVGNTRIAHFVCNLAVLGNSGKHLFIMRTVSTRKQIEKVCPVCWSTFATTRALKKFCSRPCVLIADRDRKREARAGHQTHVHRWACQECGEALKLGRPKRVEEVTRNRHSEMSASKVNLN